MDESTQESLKIRLAYILAHIQTNNMKNAEYEINLLLSEVKQGFVAPF